MITALIIVGFTGIIFCLLGYLIWKKQKITLLHDYHYDKVSTEDKEAQILPGVLLSLAQDL